MSGDRWLLLDTNYLCHRAFYTLKDLTHEGVMIGVVYGLFHTVTSLLDYWDRPKVAFCFDHGVPFRRGMLPTYKESRRRRRRADPEKAAAYKELQRQIALLKNDYLDDAGFRNVFYEKGYEADDVIARVVQQMGRKDEAIVVGSDNDLFQLLGSRVCLYNPQNKKVVTKESFEKEWGIDPYMWSTVKAIAGCSGDDVPGVPGVGEKTAIKFLSGKLPTTHKSHKRITKNHSMWKGNEILVKLPYPGLEAFPLRDDKVSEARWRRFCKRLDFDSLANWIH